VAVVAQFVALKDEPRDPLTFDGKPPPAVFSRTTVPAVDGGVDPPLFGGEDAVLISAA
jgi:hypothetical protein